MPHKSYREESKKDYGIVVPESSNLNYEQLQTGALLRIADASELMAKNFLQLQNDRDMYKRWYENEAAANQKLVRQVRAYRGIINKKKKKK